MEMRITYKGTLNGVKGVWCGFKPEGLEVNEQIEVWYPTKGMLFKKGDETFSAVILKDGEKIEDYIEVKDIAIKKREAEMTRLREHEPVKVPVPATPKEKE